MLIRSEWSCAAHWLSGMTKWVAARRRRSSARGPSEGGGARGCRDSSHLGLTFVEERVVLGGATATWVHSWSSLPRLPSGSSSFTMSRTLPKVIVTAARGSSVTAATSVFGRISPSRRNQGIWTYGYYCGVFHPPTSATNRSDCGGPQVPGSYSNMGLGPWIT